MSQSKGRLGCIDVLKRRNEFGDLLTLTLGIIFIFLGILLALQSKYVIGIDYLTRQGSGFGGYLLIGLGIIFIWTYYHSLPPFGKAKKFIESLGRRNKR